MIRANVSLREFTNYKIGGPAKYFLEVKTREELINGLKEWGQRGKVFVLGGGTNLLFSDQGFDGLVIKVSLDSISLNNNILTISSGALVSTITKFCIDNSLSGFEWAGGLPGTIGGAVRGNAGAFSGETKDNVVSVTSLNIDSLQVVARNKDECEFSYRSSIFKTKAINEIILSADFIVKKGKSEEIEKKTSEGIEFRKNKHPLENPNAGSVFKNVPAGNIPEKFKQELSQYIKNDPFPVVPAAKIIFLAGLTGRQVGQAQVSQKHTNFIINLGDATAEDVKNLIRVVQAEVKQKYEINLEPEIMILN
jgi:UDP-N-acetylmuramate dehydrogenase